MLIFLVLVMWCCVIGYRSRLPFHLIFLLLLWIMWRKTGKIVTLQKVAEVCKKTRNLNIFPCFRFFGEIAGIDFHQATYSLRLGEKIRWVYFLRKKLFLFKTSKKIIITRNTADVVSGAFFLRLCLCRIVSNKNVSKSH